MKGFKAVASWASQAIPTESRPTVDSTEISLLISLSKQTFSVLFLLWGCFAIAALPMFPEQPS